MIHSSTVGSCLPWNWCGFHTLVTPFWKGSQIITKHVEIVTRSMNKNHQECHKTRIPKIENQPWNCWMNYLWNWITITPSTFDVCLDRGGWISLLFINKIQSVVCWHLQENKKKCHKCDETLENNSKANDIGEERDTLSVKITDLKLSSDPSTRQSVGTFLFSNSMYFECYGKSRTRAI